MKKAFRKFVVTLLAACVALSALTGIAYAASVYASDGNSYIRSQPSLSGKQLATLREGDQAIYLGRSSVDNRGVDWYYVSYNGATGWVSSTYTELLGSIYAASVYAFGGDSYIRSRPSLSSAQLALFPEGESAIYLDQSSVDDRGVEWYRVFYGDTEGWVSSRYTTLDEEPELIYASDGDSYIRNQPDLSGARLALFPEGAYASYLGRSSVDDRGVEWYRVSYEGVTGWVSSRYTSFEGYGDYVAYGLEYDTVRASGGDSYIRSQPDLSGAQLGSFPKGAVADYLGRSAYDDRGVEWHRISYRGITGWVSSKYTYLE